MADESDDERARKLYRKTDPATSYRAALGILPKQNELQAKVLVWANEEPRDYYGFVDPEMEDHFCRNVAPDSKPSTWRSRRSELHKPKDESAPFIAPIGTKEYRGGTYTLWRITDRGRLPKAAPDGA